MKKTFGIFSIVLMLLLASGSNAFGALNVKVGMQWDLAGKDMVGFEVVQGGYSLEVDGKAVNGKIESGRVYRVTMGPWGMVLYENGNIIGFVKHIELEPVSGKLPLFKLYSSDNSRKYRGSLDITSTEDNKLRIINTLGEEEYLYGVVPMEMSNSWANEGMEALKAQAVAARTYLHAHYDSKLAKGYNITDSPNIDQAYAGFAVEGAASKAVDSTRGEIIIDTQSRQPINASYSSHSGGQTEDSENVWGGVDAHLRSKSDPYSSGQGFLGDAWSYKISAMALGKAVGLGPVVELKVEKFQSGRVKTVVLTDSTGKSVSKSGHQLAGIFYPKNRGITANDFLGNFFSVMLLKKGQNAKGVPRVVEQLELNADSRGGPRLDHFYAQDAPPTTLASPYPVYQFVGSGWGHGVGMSQWGALGMARKGFTYQQILNFYYTDVSLEKLK